MVGPRVGNVAPCEHGLVLIHLCYVRSNGENFE